jgi:hypothetical protein
VGVKILDLIASGSSDDGEHVWITHRLGDGAEYPLIYPFEAIGYLITILADAARAAAERPSKTTRKRSSTARTSTSSRQRKSESAPRLATWAPSCT